ncbi:hypothetical protein [Mangrovihabitans endophyticus]|nr:hypothetical protein [Mangrovihabitans endophyticus]
MSARRGWLMAALVAAVVALTGSAIAVGVGVGRHSADPPRQAGFANAAPAGAGPERMGGMAGGMMGSGNAGTWQTDGRYGLPGDGSTVTTMAAARARAQAFADQLGDGLRAGEVMQFSNGYYSELLSADGRGATEVLIDPGTGAVSIEYGPAMMWNTRYGMHPRAEVAARVSAKQATVDAQAWLDGRHAGLTAGEPMAFPGYYTLHTLKGESIVGMMSINSVSGAAWYHTWHGTFIAMTGE